VLPTQIEPPALASGQMTPGQALLLAEQKRRHGFIADADDLVRRVVAVEPGNADAQHMLGIVLHQSGKLAEAIEHVRRAAELKRFADAETCYRRAIELAPKFPDAWNNLGTCLRELKRSEDAIAAYRTALELRPNDPETLDNLALALKDLEKYEEAAATLRAAL